jgi:hypothetical protein
MERGSPSLAVEPVEALAASDGVAVVDAVVGAAEVVVDAPVAIALALGESSPSLHAASSSAPTTATTTAARRSNENGD